MSRFRMISAMAGVALAGFLTLFSVSAAQAQQATPGPKRTVLQKQDLSAPGREGVLVLVELAPGEREPKHTHPGDVFVYIQEGTPTLMKEGQPLVHLKAGDSFFVPAGTVHSAANEGTTKVKMLVTFFVEKGKPLTSPIQ